MTNKLALADLSKTGFDLVLFFSFQHFHLFVVISCVFVDIIINNWTPTNQITSYNIILSLKWQKPQRENVLFSKSFINLEKYLQFGKKWISWKREISLDVPILTVVNGNVYRHYGIQTLLLRSDLFAFQQVIKFMFIKVSKNGLIMQEIFPIFKVI